MTMMMTLIKTILDDYNDRNHDIAGNTSMRSMMTSFYLYVVVPVKFPGFIANEPAERRCEAGEAAVL